MSTASSVGQLANGSHPDGKHAPINPSNQSKTQVPNGTMAQQGNRPVGIQQPYVPHPEIAKFPLLYHSTRDSRYPTPSVKWNKIKAEVAEKNLALTMLETEQDLRVWAQRSFRAVIGVFISETCGWCGSFMPEFIKLIPTLAWQSEKKESARIEFVALDQFFKATEALKDVLPVLSRVQIDQTTQKPRLDQTGREIAFPIPSRGFPTIFALTSNKTEVHVLIRLGPPPKDLPAYAPRPGLPAGISQDSFLLGQTSKKLKIETSQVNDLFGYLGSEGVQHIQDVMTWDDTKINTTSKATFEAYKASLPQTKQQQQQQPHQQSQQPQQQSSLPAGVTTASSVPYAGLAVPRIPLLAVPKRLNELPDAKWFLSAKSPNTVDNTLEYDNLGLEFEYQTNPDHLMTELQKMARLKTRTLKEMGIPFRFVSIPSIFQTPTVQITLSDTTTGAANALNYRGGDALNILGVLESTLLSEYNSSVKATTTTQSRMSEPPRDD